MRRLAAATVAAAITLIVGGGALARPTSNRSRPDTADWGTLMTLRGGVRADARRMLATISRCEHGAHHPYGAGLDAFNQCIKPLLNQDVYKSRFEPAMLVGVLRDLAPGACAGLASGLMDAISQLGGEALTWFDDAEAGGPSAGALEQADTHDMRALARSIVAFTTARDWGTACRARPYQPSEHHARLAARRYHVRSFLLVA
jgi:hypothetical protein